MRVAMLARDCERRDVMVSDESLTAEGPKTSIAHRRNGLVNLLDLGLVDAGNVGQQVGNVAL